MVKRDSYPCPSCGLLVFDESPGSYDICPVCGWEDDHVQLAHPALRGGANRVSLFESQLAILRKLPIEVREHEGVLRDPRWRPLNEKDMELRADGPKDSTSYFHAATSEEPDYYWLRDEKA